ncbi:thiosulfate sulfurtransferase 16, chloroplastic isoform X1 [Solanum lycopersicum]|uniref:thiosulfate sulfurtransferase 16, chloroplastic isoform X1 n=1 Tax=Solanum lycopersicum TaxID=4081 RepID=UPI000532D66D|nr:thiosulfate sulfurtransferase 16, chloroplastic isoform X1 [Solanum lycopersicum]
MRTISLHSTSFSLVEFHGTKNLAQSSRINRSVSLIPMARSQFQPKIRRDIGTSNRNPSFSWMATVGEKVHNSTVPTSVPVRVALELLQAGHRYLDVRTTEEYNDGHAAGAINIPYMLRIGSGMIKNPNFLEEVLEQFGKDDEIIVGCQLGKRSFMAATELLAAGFTGVTDIAGGYAAWTESGLPIES